MTGFSGIDVADMVHQMMRAESFRLDRLRQQRDINVWRQDMMRNMATSINQFNRNWTTPFATGSRDIGNPANWNANTATVTGLGGANAAGVSVTAGSNARVGTHTLHVHQVAQAETFRSQNNFNTGATSVNMDFSHLLDSNGDFTSGMNFNVSVNGATRNISVSEAQLDTWFTGLDRTVIQGHLSYIADREVEIAALVTTSPTFADDRAALQNRIQVRRDAIGLEFSDYITGGAGAPSANAQAFTTELNRQIRDHFGYNAGGTPGDINDQRASIRVVGNELVFRVSEGNTASVLNGTGAGAMTTRQMGLTEVAAGGAVSMAFNLGQRLEDFFNVNTAGTLWSNMTNPPTPPVPGDSAIFFSINDARFEVDFTRNEIRVNGTRVFGRAEGQHLTLNDMMNAVNNSSAAAVNLNFNVHSGQFTMQATQTGAMNEIRFSNMPDGSPSDAPNSSSHNFFFELFGTNSLATARIQEAQDAEFQIHDGFSLSNVMSRSSNNFTVNDLTFNLTAAAQPADPNVPTQFTVQVGRNTNDVREMVTDFVNAYNDLMRSLRDLTEVRRPRQEGGFFMPLTEEQRRGMSDREIEMWEEQARTGLLHRDETLRAIQREMTDLMFRNVTMPDGRTFNLGNMGIQLSRDANTPGLLTIDEDRFELALEHHGDVMQHIFTSAEPRSNFTNDRDWLNGNGLAVRLRHVFDRATHHDTGTITRRAGVAGGIWDSQSAMSLSISNDNRRIDNMLNWLQRREDSLFRQFSRMEQAMMQANSQMMFFEQLMWQGM